MHLEGNMVRQNMQISLFKFVVVLRKLFQLERVSTASMGCGSTK